MHASPEFDDERTALRAEPNRDVRPGGRVALTLTACNAGTAAADAVTATLELPEALVPVRGASTIDGQAVRERRKDPLHFDLGRIDAGATVTLRAEATVASPLPNGTTLPASVTLSWEPARDAASRRLECSVAVRSNPRCRHGEMPCSEPAATSSSRAVKSKRSLRSPTTARRRPATWSYTCARIRRSATCAFSIKRRAYRSTAIRSIWATPRLCNAEADAARPRSFAVSRPQRDSHRSQRPHARAG